jgi:hypothetical protein
LQSAVFAAGRGHGGRSVVLPARDYMQEPVALSESASLAGKSLAAA